MRSSVLNLSSIMRLARLLFGDPNRELSHFLSRANRGFLDRIAVLHTGFHKAVGVLKPLIDSLFGEKRSHKGTGHLCPIQYSLMVLGKPSAGLRTSKSAGKNSTPITSRAICFYIKNSI